MKDGLTINVPDEAYPYLVAQRGALDDMRDNQLIWLARYSETLFDEFDLIEHHLPEACEAILDVGSGLGGIDALINAHYGGECRVTLIDGVDDPPHVRLHRVTFNSMAVARRFLEVNGVEHFSHIDANDPARCVSITYDVIVSQKSWCFHYAPDVHLPLVLKACHLHSRLFVDVRLDKPDWLYRLQEFFDSEVISEGKKALTFCMWPNAKFREQLRG